MVPTPPRDDTGARQAQDLALWSRLVTDLPDLRQLIVDRDSEIGTFDIYCRLAHWYGYGDRRGQGVKERWHDVWESSSYRDNHHAYDVGYRMLNDTMPPCCDHGCGC